MHIYYITSPTWYPARCSMGCSVLHTVYSKLTVKQIQDFVLDCRILLLKSTYYCFPFFSYCYCRPTVKLSSCILELNTSLRHCCQQQALDSPWTGDRVTQTGHQIYRLSDWPRCLSCRARPGKQSSLTDCLRCLSYRDSLQNSLVLPTVDGFHGCGV